MSTEGRNRILNAETLIPAGVLVALLGPLIWVTWLASQTFYGFTGRLESLERAVATKDGWTYAMERDAWAEFRYENPTIKIPDHKRIYIDHTTK